MNKTMIGLCIIGVVFLLAMPAATMAKDTKPDKTTCYIMDGNAGGEIFDQAAILLGTKSSGVTGKDIDTKIKYYNIVGSMNPQVGDTVPFSGSMFYFHLDSGNLLYGETSGMKSGDQFGCTLWLFDNELTTDKTICDINDTLTWYDLLEVDCKDHDFDYSFQGMPAPSPQTLRESSLTDLTSN